MRLDQPRLLALDAGGTSTRAVALTAAGDVTGVGRSAAGNPTSAGIESAVESMGTAAESALRTGSGSVELAVIAMAGEKREEFVRRVTDRLGALGVERVVLDHDILAIFCSGTAAADGYALIAGTGSVAARVAEGQVAAVAGGRGWLLGDAGGGFWIGRRVARAVVSALDGQSQPTALTPLVLGALGITADLTQGSGRVDAIRQTVGAVYARRPLALAELAPLAFRVPEDPVARAILVEASQALADLLATVVRPDIDGPVVVGGSVIVQGLLASRARIGADFVPPAGDRSVLPVSDGLVGAAVLALRHLGRTVDKAALAALQQQVAAGGAPRRGSAP